jgi:hypothetical protein
VGKLCSRDLDVNNDSAQRFQFFDATFDCKGNVRLKPIEIVIPRFAYPDAGDIAA